MMNKREKTIMKKVKKTMEHDEKERKNKEA